MWRNSLLMARVTFSIWASIPISHLLKNIALAILLLLSYVFNLFHLYLPWASQVALEVKEPSCNAGDPRDAGSIPGSGRFPGGVATHSSILAWRIPWTEEPGRLQSTGSQRVGPRLKWLSTQHSRTYCIAEGTLPNTLEWPIWEKNF